MKTKLLSRIFFLQIWLAEKNFRLISGLAEFYETNKIRLNQQTIFTFPP